MERYIAIDNVCAWPNLTQMPDGSIVATIFNQPCHGRWQGDVECWASEDEGRSWRLRGVPALHEPGTNRMNVAAGLARNGDLMVLAGGHSSIPKESDAKKTGSIEVGEPLAPWICRSVDGGKTWQRTGTLQIPEALPGQIPFGDIVAGPDGSLGVSVYDFKRTDREHKDTLCTAYFVRSRDDGRTWGEASVVAADMYNEADLLYLDGNRWLTVVRTMRDAHLELFTSDDGGDSWLPGGPLTGTREHPAHLLQLSDGRIVMTYGIRHQGFYGIGARLSEDEGKTWRTPMVLLDLEIADDGGYPSSIQLKDGSILTAYYASGIRAHMRYHMGVVRWKPEEVTARNRW